MAVTRTEFGWILTADGDVASDPGGHDILIQAFHIQKTTTGTVTFRDGAGNLILTTNSITGGTGSLYTPFVIRVNQFEMDANSAGTSVVTVYGAVVN